MSEYEPHREAMADVSYATQFADIDWERSLEGRLEDVVHYGLTIMPYEELFSLAMKVSSSNTWPMWELPRYLSGRLSRHLNLKYACSISRWSRDLYL